MWARLIAAARENQLLILARDIGDDITSAERRALRRGGFPGEVAQGGRRAPTRPGALCLSIQYLPPTQQHVP